MSIMARKPQHHWSLNLIAAMNDPQLKIEEDDRIVVLKDKYPKARFHYLILPKKEIHSISHVTTSDLKLLEYMEHVGKLYANKNKEYEFEIGYHAIPSLKQLHLHVISTDFDSPCLKTKHHWNSFTTPHFITAQDIAEQLVVNGKITIDIRKYKEYLERNLKCHKCSYEPKTMPDLKRHITEHIILK